MNRIKTIHRSADFLAPALAVCLFILGGCNEEASNSASSTGSPSGSASLTAVPESAPDTSVPAVAALAAAAPASAAALPPLSLEIGAGYNEQIANINNSVIAKSGARWVRAYVNLSRNYWVFANTFPAPSPTPTPTPPVWPRSAITGLVEGNIIQQASNVSSDADTLAVAAIDQLINTKTVQAGGNPINVILSLKHDFSFPYPASAVVPPDQFPDLATTAGAGEIAEMVTSIENLLTTNNRGNEIDILVTGNEPMFEIQPNTNPDTARKYKLYLNFLITALVNLKTAQNTLSPNGIPNTWHFEIFVGALNSPIDPIPLGNVILPAVLEVARDNPDVDGIDLHEHVAATSEVHGDIQYVKDHTKLRPPGVPPLKIISTEFSIIRLLESQMTKAATSGPPLGTFINNTITQAGAGTPVSQDDFLNYFLKQAWYPQHWFREMINSFEAEGVYAVTYGLEETPRYPWSLNAVSSTAMPWVLNGVYNATLLGRSTEGFPNTNPLVWPEFQEAVDRMP